MTGSFSSPVLRHSSLDKKFPGACEGTPGRKRETWLFLSEILYFNPSQMIVTSKRSPSKLKK